MKNQSNASSKLHSFFVAINAVVGSFITGILIVSGLVILNGSSNSIPEITMAEFDDRFSFEKNLGKSQKESQVVITSDDGLFLPAQELAIMGMLSKNSKNILEFGTGAGRTTWVMAKNSQPSTRILTINLLPNMMGDVTLPTSETTIMHNIKSDSKYQEFFFDKSDVAHKITLKSIDSKLFNENEISQKFDLIFVDGGHSYSYVKNDTEKAFKLLAPGGVIVWDDSAVFDIAKYLNELSQTKNLMRIAGTKFTIYKDTKAE